MPLLPKERFPMKQEESERKEGGSSLRKSSGRNVVFGSLLSFLPSSRGSAFFNKLLFSRHLINEVTEIMISLPPAALDQSFLQVQATPPRYTPRSLELQIVLFGRRLDFLVSACA